MYNKHLVTAGILMSVCLLPAHAIANKRLPIDGRTVQDGDPALQAQINLLIQTPVDTGVVNPAPAKTANENTKATSDAPLEDSPVDLEIENGEIIVIDKDEPVIPDVAAEDTTDQCAPEAMAVGIMHYKYNEAPAADLVWSGFGGQSDLKFRIHRDAKDALQELVEAARRDGARLQPGSIFRSVARQRQIVNARIEQKHTPKQIYFTSAHPGFSEHHTGLAVDFSPINDEFAKTAEYRWLLKNANKYGWYQTFTKEYSEKSGVSEESWHWRYEGKDGEFAHIFEASINHACQLDENQPSAQNTVQP